MSKEKKRDPIKVMLRVTIVLAVVAVAALLLGNAIIGYLSLIHISEPTRP